MIKTYEEYLEKCRIRAKEYYHKKKQNPHWLKLRRAQWKEAKRLQREKGKEKTAV